MKKWNFESEQWQKLSWSLKHLPIFSRPYDFVSFLFRLSWAMFLKLFFTFWIRLEVKGDFKEVYRKNPRLLLISNHVSHLDTVALMAAMPFKLWADFFSVAAQDYFFKNPVFSFFSKHCLGAIPLDRNGPSRTGTTLLCVRLLQKLDRVWMLIFPEGGRSADGRLRSFKRGVSMFAKRTETPILFLHIEGGYKLWPKGKWLPKLGQLTVHVGPVHAPAEIDIISHAYREWVGEIANDVPVLSESAN